MSASMRIDTSRFEKAMREYAKVTTKDQVEIINKKGWFIVKNTIQRTRAADKAKIRKFFRKGNRKEWGPWVMAFFKLNKATPGWDLDEYMKKAKALKLKSVGYLRSGWIVALRAFGKASKSKKTAKGVKMVGRPKGKASVAKRRKNGDVTAFMSNTIGRGGKEHAKALSFWGKKALQHAVNAEAKSMKRYAEKKLVARQRKMRLK